MKKKKGFLLLAAAAVIMTMLAGTSLYARGQLEQKAEAVKTEAHTESLQEVEQRDPADTESVNAGEAQEVRSQSEENDGEHQEKMIIALDPGHQLKRHHKNIRCREEHQCGYSDTAHASHSKIFFSQRTLSDRFSPKEKCAPYRSAKPPLHFKHGNTKNALLQPQINNPHI